jgi:long-chain acyl-CoA synthetase
MAGFAAVPANAKLHGRELGYILEHSGARICFATPGLDAEVAPHAPPSLERLIVIGSESYRALFARDAVAVTRRDGNDLAWLFYTSGTTGRPKGAMLTAPGAGAGELSPISPRWTRTAPERLDPACGADEPRLRPLHDGACRPARHQRGAGIRRLRAGRDLPPVRHRGRASSMFAAPTMVKRLIDFGGGADRQPAHHRVGRRADVCRGRPQGARPLRPAASRRSTARAKAR